MAKRSEIQSDNFIEENLNLSSIDSGIVIRSLYPAKMKITAPSGKVYIFEDAGSEVKVAEEDVAFLLEKRQPSGCCSGNSPMSYFEKSGGN